MGYSRSKNRRRHRRATLVVERLEFRRVMSSSPIGGLIDPGLVSPEIANPSLNPDLSIIGQSPSPGSDSPGGLRQVSVQFDRPVDPWSLGFMDVQVLSVAPDGKTTPVISDTTSLDESLDPSGTILTVTLPRPLAAGHYRLILSANAFLSGIDGSFLPFTGEDTPLGDFDIVPAAPTLADAIDLGRLSSSVTTANGRLDPASNPHDVALYRFEVAPQYAFSRVGVEVSAQRIGSPLNSAILLLDAGGSSIAYSDLGRPGTANDPYLFQGLRPGVYYIAVVSGQMGYGPTSHFDAAKPPLPRTNFNPVGGPFTLRLVADPAETPAAMIGFGLLHQDPLDRDPTGFTLQFNAPLALTDSSGKLFDVMSRGVQVLDAGGRSWPIAGVAYDEATSTLTYVFRQRLPQGSYSVQIPTTGGLVDLSGQRPTAYGHANGVFGSFSVGAMASSAGPDDLGPLYPDDLLNTVSHDVVVPAGATVSIRYVILYSDFYKITTRQLGGTPTATLLDPGSYPTGTTSYEFVAAGVHVFTLKNPGNAPITYRFQLGIAAYHWESLLQSGIGQGPALGLRLIAPDVSPSAPAPPSAPADGSTGSEGIAALFPAAVGVMTGGIVSSGDGQAASHAPGPVEPVPILPTNATTGLYLTFAGQPVGSPVVNTAQGSGGFAAFSPGSATGFGQSVGSGNSFAGASSSGLTAPNAENVPGTDAAPEDEDAPAADLAALLAAAHDAEASIEEIASDLSPAQEADPLRTDGSLPDSVVESAWTPPEDRTMPEEARIFDPGLGLGLAAAVAIHYRQAIRGWFSRFRRKNTSARRLAPAPAPRRSRSTRSREEHPTSSRSSRSESREQQLVMH
jgi:hypothetical protein